MVVVALSCSGSHGVPTVQVVLGPQPSAAPGASSARNVIAPAPSSSAAVDPEPPTLWQSEDAVNALAGDCHWEEQCIHEVEKASLTAMGERPPVSEGCGEALAMGCVAIPDQPCNPDECAQTDQSCIPECDRTCGSCADTCTTGCDDCKRQCQDEACRHACGERTAQCHRQCVSALDRCTTAHCSEEARSCVKSRDAEWVDGHCEAACTKVTACAAKCPNPKQLSGYMLSEEPCPQACAKKLPANCARFAAYCTGFTDAWNVHAEPEDEHR